MYLGTLYIYTKFQPDLISNMAVTVWQEQFTAHQTFSYQKDFDSKTNPTGQAWAM
jgi:hypothetical protein